ncbi:MAG: ATP-binding protein [Kiritimatiellaeota bacterium]|jgi:DNA replication protein DnaC|nr:ATP-binding protein [Kiritimatiellota bacterium]
MSTINETLDRQLTDLKMPFLREHYRDLAKHAVAKALGHVDYLAMLVDGETHQRGERSIRRRIRQARFPYLKTLDQFDFTHPKKIDRMEIKDLFGLDFVKEHGNVIFVGPCGMGKTHLAIALGHQACVAGYKVLFTTAIDMVNVLAAAQAEYRIDRQLAKYLKPDLLIIDELGYLPIDKFGADLLFQIVGGRYERSSIILTTNRIFKDWATVFNNDAALASVVLDRLLHHHRHVIIEGTSYRMRKPLR